jgi:MFS family permease
VQFAATAPTFFLTLVGGVIADRYERRRLLIINQAILMILALLLGLSVSFDSATIPFILTISFAAGVANSFTFPAWQAFIPELVPKKDLLNAIALNSAQFNAARLIGPAVAGFLIGLWGVASSFYINAASFLAVILALAFISPRPVAQKDTGEHPWRNFTQGIVYARQHTSVAVLLISIGMLTIFGLSHTVLMPAFARDILDVGPQGLGALMAFGGFGAVLGALIVAGLAPKTKRSSLVKIGILTYSISLFVFASSKIFIISLIAQFFVGMSFLTSISSINTSIQSSAPANIRGRVVALYIWSFLGLFPIGSFLIGTVARLFGSPVAVAGGSAVLLLVATTLYARPDLLKDVG